MIRGIFALVFRSLRGGIPIKRCLEMSRGIFALFFRSLRCDSRSIWVHASWLFLLLVIYVAMSVAQAQERFYGAPGLLFFQYVIYCNAGFMTLLGISYFSSVISEEKEEDTLGLMTMAGISPLGILLGKSTTRLFQVMLLLAVQYPFTLLAITLGGLAPEQIYSAYAALLAFTILLANVGLFCSVICRRNRSAAGLTTLWMIGYGFAPVFALIAQEYLRFRTNLQDPGWIAASARWTPFLTWVSETSVFVQLYSATETGHQFSLTPQLVSNSMGGVILFLMSWWLFGLIGHESSVEASTRAMVPRGTGRLRWFSTGRVWEAALAWKDFHFIAGGWPGVLIRCGLYLGLYWLCYAANCSWDDSYPVYPMRWQDVTIGYQFFVVPLFLVDCSLCMTRLFHEEIRLQTLSSLLMLPRSVPHLVYMKLAGCIAGLVPGMIALFTAFVLLSQSRNTLWEAIDEPVAWWLIANMLLFVHLSAMLSAYLRWGAFALSLALTVGSMMISVMLIEMMRVSRGGGGMNPQVTLEFTLGLLCVPMILACAGCHFAILLRLPALGEK